MKVAVTAFAAGVALESFFCGLHPQLYAITAFAAGDSHRVRGIAMKVAATAFAASVWESVRTAGFTRSYMLLPRSRLVTLTAFAACVWESVLVL